MTAAARLYSRLEPIAYDDGDDVLSGLCTALMAPVEVTEVSRDTLLTLNPPTTLDFADEPDGPLAGSFEAWTASMPTISGGKAFDTGGLGDATWFEAIGPNSFAQLIFDPVTLNNGQNFGVGIRLTAHSGAANGYMFELSDSGTGFTPKIYKGSGFTTVATGSPAGAGATVTGIRLDATGTTLDGYFRIDEEWTLVVTATDATYSAAGYPGFWVQDPTVGADLGATEFTFGVTDDPVVVELTAWEALWDPDACPAALLGWLAVANGVVLPPSALTAAEKRYRIKQAAGRYRGTPRALVEEIQLELDPTSSQTVLMAFQTPDRWSYLVGTIDSETPDEDAVEAAIERQNPAFMLWDRVLTSDWSWFVLAPTLVATRVDDVYTIGAPEYPTWQSVLDAFSDWQHVIDNDPDL